MTPRYIPFETLGVACRQTANLLKMRSYIRVAAIATVDGAAKWIPLTKDSLQCSGRGLVHGLLVGVPEVKDA